MNQCPACKKYVGLWNRDGEQIACEYHNHRVVQVTDDAYLGRRMLFFVHKELTCNKTVKEA